MNTPLLKQVAKYTLLFLLSIALLWYVLRQVDLNEVISRLAEVNYSWIVASMLFGLLSHLIRAWRWTLMLHPLGHRPPLGTTFTALMVGYLANLALPRFGEIARCGVLRKNAGIPFPAAFGTVLAERAIDLIALLLIVGVTLLLEFDRLGNFLADVFAGGSRPSTGFLLAVGIGGLSLLLAGLYLWRLFHPRLMRYPLYQKVVALGSDLVSGLLSVGRIRQQGAFWGSSLLIWGLYYLMSYIVVFSIPQTQEISLLAGLSILAMGGIGMAAPVQGGIGAYHLLVSGVLIIYGASQSDAVLLTLLLHTSQILLILLVGGISLLVSIFTQPTAPNHAAKPA
ncbi:lysylphosphatidylglycerol synthase transmembrane domain-containing protein [Cesiribacter andamanensis]|uniref:Uncharacterized protein n=1 Tax=Cesiribacter andamanensis AMV16 TaxID=1279009 RepID=M7N5E6_9BACT|nr:lysylphosphatidylglycerol synthase transmembrane domain-containing protein [Cesiribacter andamanensis]EMR03838.1 hypothetical protein ADICEAN_00987 [Cesiribacter andamanensis AMV16]